MKDALSPRPSTILALLAFGAAGMVPPAEAQTGGSGGGCLTFPGEPIVTGDLVQFEIDSLRYLVIPVQFSDETSFPLSELELAGRANAVDEALFLNSYETLTPDRTIVWPPVQLDYPKSHYQNCSQYLRPDILAAANAWLVGETVEDDYDREIILHSGITIGQGQATRSVLVNPVASPYVWAHELGHTFRWGHANFLNGECCEPLLGERGYGDRYDMMGDFLNSHHYNPWFKRRAGWLGSGDVVTVPVDTPGTYTYRIRRLDLIPGGPNPTVLRVPRTKKEDVWVYNRGPNGATRFGSTGVMLSYGYPTNVKPSRLIDVTPDSLTGSVFFGGTEFPTDYQDAVVIPGFENRYVDPLTSIVYTVLAIGEASSWVEIRIEVPEPGLDLDQVPVVDVVAPAAGVTQSGVSTFTVETFDPDCPTPHRNGKGIDWVDLAIYANTDTLTKALREGNPLPPNPEASIHLTQPPYELTYDTAFSADSLYMLVVTSRGDAGQNRVGFGFYIGNSGPTPVGLPPCMIPD